MIFKLTNKKKYSHDNLMIFNPSVTMVIIVFLILIKLIFSIYSLFILRIIVYGYNQVYAINKNSNRLLKIYINLHRIVFLIDDLL